MKGKGIKSVILVMVLLMVTLTGCQKQKEETSENNIYYVDKTMSKLVPVPYEPISEKDGEIIDDMISKLSEETNSVEYKNPLPHDVKLLYYSMNENQLELNFDSNYSNMDNVTEVLLRASIVYTLSQIESVKGVSFYIGDSPLMDERGNAFGVMTTDSFIENPGEQINFIQVSTVTLYFSNKKGNGLVKEVQENVHYNGTTSMEKLVMERLMAGPDNENGVSTIPAETNLVSVSVLDGVCFVNLDEGFLNHNYNISEGVVIYSIVNSLAELTNVNKVQISVNGDTSINYREKFSLGTVYERNLDYLDTEEKEDSGE